MDLKRLSGSQLRETLMKMSSASAAGCDCWRIDELKRLPEQFFDRLASMFTVVEETGIWPAAICEGIVSLISKGEGTEPSKLRPIGVMSAIIYIVYGPPQEYAK